MSGVSQVLVRNLERDGEGRRFAAHGHAQVLHAGAAGVSRGTFEPGWRWSEDVRPLVGTEQCMVRHLGLVEAGRMRIVMADGAEQDIGPGDLVDIPAGHDAWVLGDEPCVLVDFSPEATRYAVSRPQGIAGADDSAMTLVRRGYAAFAAGDFDTLRAIMARDVVQHVPGQGPLSGHHKGIDAVLDYYGKLFELSGGTFRADLIEVHGDGAGHALAVHQTSMERNGARRIAHGSILFTVLGDRATDLLELRADLPGDDAFMA